ncbi:GPW/gp25 family protein [Microvirga splendida]|uniref:GPW/gp25 family protein n=1 Tax=Microvirga splendida TaxID=2795727 RepID=A0ABS0Y4F3_9HYPH|nr:GPW/gp25 family protein [Microvirga splendida]MBJ6127195.1 GPW/gp25 family protein [Microvirga splendida]
MNERKDWQGIGWAFPIRADAATGTPVLSRYENDIREAIRIILGTARGERVMRPDFGCGIHTLVFDVVDVAMLTRVEAEVRESIVKYEPRVELIGVRADPFEAANGMLLVEVEYRVRQTNQTGNLVYPFYFREGGNTRERGRG